MYAKYAPETKPYYTFIKDEKEESNQDVCKAAYHMVCDLYQKQEQKNAIRANYTATNPIRQQLYELVGGPVNFSLKEELCGMNYRVLQPVYDEMEEKMLVVVYGPNGEEIKFIKAGLKLVHEQNEKSGRFKEEVVASIGQNELEPLAAKELFSQIQALRNDQGPKIGLGPYLAEKRDVAAQLGAAYATAKLAR